MTNDKTINQKKSFITAIIMTSIAIIIEILCILLGFQSIDLLYNPQERFDALAALFTIPFFLISSCGNVVLNSIGATTSIRCISKKYHLGATIPFTVINFLMSITNTVILLIIISK